jgi:peptide/nickel transport system ATP-binding protein
VPELASAGEDGHLVACHLSAADRQGFYERDIAAAGVTT